MTSSIRNIQTEAAASVLRTHLNDLYKTVREECRKGNVTPDAKKIIFEIFKDIERSKEKGFI